MGVLRGTFSQLVSSSWLETVMRERFVRFRHAVHFFALLHRATAAFRSFGELGCEPGLHRFLAATARCIAHPAHRKRHAAHGTHFDRHLIIRAADAAAFYFHHRLHV